MRISKKIAIALGMVAAFTGCNKEPVQPPHQYTIDDLNHSYSISAQITFTNSSASDACTNLAATLRLDGISLDDKVGT